MDIDIYIIHEPIALKVQFAGCCLNCSKDLHGTFGNCPTLSYGRKIILSFLESCYFFTECIGLCKPQKFNRFSLNHSTNELLNLDFHSITQEEFLAGNLFIINHASKANFATMPDRYLN